MTRMATRRDIPRLVEMGQHFLDSTVYRGLIGRNTSQMAATASMLIDSPDGCVVVAERSGVVVGMLGALVFTHHISGERVGGEVFWWVEPEHRGCGVRLLKASETWARARGAVRMQMIAPTPDVGALYQRMGYAAVETTYQRSLVEEN
jgi:GNAT superfamily N-acetyltransferase